jgi:hypothetical protein
MQTLTRPVTVILNLLRNFPSLQVKTCLFFDTGHVSIHPLAVLKLSGKHAGKRINLAKPYNLWLVGIGVGGVG